MEGDQNNGHIYEFGRFRLDPAGKTLYENGSPLHLPSKEFETLLVLVRNNGRAMSKDELMSAVWGDTVVEEVNLAKQISRLRKVLAEDGVAYIDTIPKHGYRFTADLNRGSSELNGVSSIDSSVEEMRPAAIPVRRRSPVIWAGIGLLALAGSAFLIWNLRSSNAAVSEAAVTDPYAPVRLTDNPADDTGPSWSKDGRIRFTRFLPDRKIETWIMNADGTEQTLIPMTEGRRIYGWSPDEKKVFLKKDGDPKTYLANTDGSGEIAVPFSGGTWSADSSMIVYWSKVAGSNYDIFVYTVETGKSRNITNHDAFDADPAISPDGKTVVFASGRDGNAEIYAVDSDGSNLRRLTFDTKTDAHPAFSPDGTKISFNSDRENENGDVYLMNVEGSDQTKLTNFDRSNETLGPGGWSRDGTKIVFFSDRNGKDDIYVMSAETIRPKAVVADKERDIRGFSYSPDGSRIAFSEELADRSGELKVTDTRTGRSSLVRKTDLAFTAPEWSPDGSKLAYTDRVGGNSEICAINADGSGWQNLSNDPAQDHGPSWSPDGKQIAFITARGEPLNVSQIFRMNADGSNAGPVTPQKGWEGSPVGSDTGKG